MIINDNTMRGCSGTVSSELEKIRKDPKCFLFSFLMTKGADKV